MWDMTQRPFPKYWTDIFVSFVFCFLTSLIRNGVHGVWLLRISHQRKNCWFVTNRDGSSFFFFLVSFHGMPPRTFETSIKSHSTTFVMLQQQQKTTNKNATKATTDYWIILPRSRTATSVNASQLNCGLRSTSTPANIARSPLWQVATDASSRAMAAFVKMSNRLQRSKEYWKQTFKTASWKCIKTKRKRKKSIWIDRPWRCCFWEISQQQQRQRHSTIHLKNKFLLGKVKSH